LEHRRGKRFYPRVRKGMHIKGIADHVSRERLLHELQEHNSRRVQLDTEHLPHTSPTAHHHISAEVKNKIRLARWVNDNKDDLAIEVQSVSYNLHRHFVIFIPGLWKGTKNTPAIKGSWDGIYR